MKSISARQCPIIIQYVIEDHNNHVIILSLNVKENKETYF